MISRPARQASLRPARRSPAIPASEHAALAMRLTRRDRWILRMLHEHRVLTTPQLAVLAFPTLKIARRRLLLLHHAGVVDRFRPFRAAGSAPAHWVLAPAGAAVLAAEIGVDVRDIGYRSERAVGIAHSLTLAHTVGVGDWFTSLATNPHRDSGLTVWWSETRCQRLWGDLARPDGYGRYTHRGHSLDFFLEYDLGSENTGQVTRKLHDYAELARTTGITTPLLIWTPTTDREAHLRHALTTTHRDLPDPDAVPIATAAADLLHHLGPSASPADRAWLPLESAATERLRLHQLATTWTHLNVAAQKDTAATTGSLDPAPHQPFPAPPPLPPRDEPL
ncbi:replication-relaxation family protein [Nocardia cyriacigeorgica]|uniref:replication-relaxation family protein n=1 Tax=Nocardia cyriacigeorgica TaxID=135487 RepID=UPI0018949278|nr:replication-relaxation family protein [Nocardia cyriacigeorgica]MBF6397876.1 replication-relaxation family protein [Nocardia cyriacigeorgica]MBF6402467.1 replication-relaxation family protein [Nocardia cyriacigeorgica]MBF6518594.1 replication-relaxation family protein [Nocardia cyriacigeorgica]